MRLYHVKKAGTFLAMGFVNVPVIRTVVLSGAVAQLICAPEGRLQMYAVYRDRVTQPVPACQSGRICMTLFVECMIRMITLLLADMNGSDSSVRLLTAVWARLVFGRENVLLMGVLSELLFTKPAVTRMARL